MNFYNDELDAELSLLEQLHGYFAEHANEFLDLDGRNLEELKRKSHKLKSSCHSFGAQELAKQLNQLEVLCAEKNEDKAIAAFKELHPKVTECKTEIQNLVEELMIDK